MGSGEFPGFWRTGWFWLQSVILCGVCDFAGMVRLDSGFGSYVTQEG